MHVAGIDIFVTNLLFMYFLMSQHSGIEAAQANFT
jgi:hypothetical protein